MSIHRRVDKLEDQTPKHSLKWDGRKETAEEYVKAMVHSFDGNGPTEDLPDLGDTDAEAYVLGKLAK